MVTPRVIPKGRCPLPDLRILPHPSASGGSWLRRCSLWPTSWRPATFFSLLGWQLPLMNECCYQRIPGPATPSQFLWAWTQGSFVSCTSSVTSHSRRSGLPQCPHLLHEVRLWHVLSQACLPLPGFFPRAPPCLQSPGGLTLCSAVQGPASTLQAWRMPASLPPRLIPRAPASLRGQAQVPADSPFHPACLPSALWGCIGARVVVPTPSLPLPGCGGHHTRKGYRGWVLSIQRKDEVSMAALESLWVFMDAGVYPSSIEK